MAKRFTCSDKWKKKFFKDFPMRLKLFWLYILDDCDHAGIWHTDFEVASLRIGDEVTEKEATEAFKDKVIVFDEGEKWFIPSFIEFQYGKLNENNRLHHSVIDILQRNDLLNSIKGLICPVISPLQGAKDKDKEKDKDKYKEKVKEIIKYFNKITNSNYRITSEKTASHVRARLREGFTVNDFKKVIQKKYNEWKGTEWEKFIRPETLFSNKFEGYLNQLVTKKKSKMSEIQKLYEEAGEEDNEETGTNRANDVPF